VTLRNEDPRVDQALVDAVAAELAARRRPFCKAIRALQRAATALGVATPAECERMFDEEVLLADALESLFDRMAAMVRGRERLSGQGNFGDDADDSPPAHPKFVEVGLIGGLTGVAGAVLRPARADDVEELIGLSRRAWLSAFERTAPRAWREFRRRAAMEEGSDWLARSWRRCSSGSGSSACGPTSGARFPPGR
jgi:hypothetical protein